MHAQRLDQTGHVGPLCGERRSALTITNSPAFVTCMACRMVAENARLHESAVNPGPAFQDVVDNLKKLAWGE